MPKSPKTPEPVPTAIEWWDPMQVASFMKMNYQRARNAMLEGQFGESQYDAKTRKLTVDSRLVREAKAKRTRSRRKRSRSASSASRRTR